MHVGGCRSVGLSVRDGVVVSIRPDSTNNRQPTPHAHTPTDEGQAAVAAGGEGVWPPAMGTEGADGEAEEAWRFRKYGKLNWGDRIDYSLQVR